MFLDIYCILIEKWICFYIITNFTLLKYNISNYLF